MPAKLNPRPLAFRQISSTDTSWWKHVFPTISFAFLGLAALISALIGFAIVRGVMEPDGWQLLPVPVFAMIFGSLYFRHVVYDLVDAVFDGGDSLVFRKDGEEVGVPLSDVAAVVSPVPGKPMRVELILRSDTPLGRKVAFLPKRPFTLNPLASNPIIDDLIERIDRSPLNDLRKKQNSTHTLRT